MPQDLLVQQVLPEPQVLQVLQAQQDLPVPRVLPDLRVPPAQPERCCPANWLPMALWSSSPIPFPPAGR